MPIHVGEVSSEIQVFEGDLPLSEAQIEKLVAIVMKRLERQQREAKRDRDATLIRRRSAPPLRIDD
ncbi:MAG: hypothetical protein MI924_00200 [Chloroflexales bacterium]|nr:hypothetical protein [Chloroflexales bacterium]